MKIRRSYIDFEKDKLIIPLLYGEENLELEFLENETFESFLKKHCIEAWTDLLNFLHSGEESFVPNYQEIKYDWPWSVNVYEYECFYIISSSEISECCPSVPPSMIAIEKSEIGLASFIKEFCLPFIKSQSKFTSQE